VRIRSKLFVTFLISSTFLVVMMYSLIQWTVDKELVKYINIREQAMLNEIAEKISEAYNKYDDWSFIQGDPRQLNEIVRGVDSALGGRRHPPRHGADFPPHAPPHLRHNKQFRNGEADDVRENESYDNRINRKQFDNGFPPPPRGEIGKGGFAVLDLEKNTIVGRYNADNKYVLTPIKLEAKQLGWLVFKRPKNPGDDFDLQFQSSLSQGFIIISVFVMILSAGFAIPLTFFVVRRLKYLTQGALAIARGDFSYRIKEGSNDEIGQLSKDFNHLAGSLEQNEQARKRWIADISHELRTPLAITLGELEAMMDGVRPLSKEGVISAHSEILHLRRLVNDLYEMTNSEIGAMSYHKKSIDLGVVLQHEIDQFHFIAEDKGLDIQLDIRQPVLSVLVDEDRVKQLIQNILANSVKYTDAPGKIEVSLDMVEKQGQPFAVLCFNDSSPSVATAHLDKLFDHLYRVDASRNRKTGGSGLGLTICRQIVDAHQGDISAAKSSLGGLSITVELPFNHHKG